MIIIKQLFFITLFLLIFNSQAKQLNFDGEITTLEQNENNDLIVSWEGKQEIFVNVIGPEGVSLKTISMIGGKPAILYRSISSSVKSDTYYTLKIDNNNVFIDCMYTDLHRGQLTEKYGVCNLHIQLNDEYIDKVNIATNGVGSIDYFSAYPFGINLEDFMKNPHWPLVKQLYEYESMSFNLQYDSKAAFDALESEAVVRYGNTYCTFGSIPTFVIFDAVDLKRPTRFEFTEQPSYEHQFYLLNWDDLRNKLSSIDNENNPLCSSF